MSRDKLKVSILLPYKENFSPDYAGAVSIFIKSVNQYSKYKNDIKVYGNTTLKKKFSKNYINIPIKKTYVLGIPKSSTKT